LLLQQADTTLAERATEAIGGAAETARQWWDLLLNPATFFAVLGVVLQITLIIGLALVAVRIVGRITNRWNRSVQDFPAVDPRRQRTLTLSNLIRSIAHYVIWPMVGISILATVGFNVTGVLAGAGIAGLAIGFGAQTLVRDVISGIFLLFDDTIHVGDLVTFNGHAGVVEHVGIRLIKVRKFDGELVMVPAGELRTFGNKSLGFARAIVPLGVSYEQDIDEVMRALKEIAHEWASDPENRANLLQDEPEIQAVMDLGESSVTVRIVVQMIPGTQFAAERALRLLVKRRFDEWGVEIPFPRRTVYMRQEPETPARRPTRPEVDAAHDGEAAGSE
jgi:moderate conductance mechanosensitive channel